MRRGFWLKVCIVTAMLALLTGMAFTQSNVKNGPKYDMAGEAKIKGVVEDMRDMPGTLDGTYLVVKTDSKSALVYVGPGDFLKEIEVSFTKGDQVDVVGSKAPGSGEEIIMAREITVGTNTFTLRDEKGVPVWSGWKPPKAGK